MKKIKRNMLFFILLMGIFPIYAHAQTVQFTLCFGENGAYSITYDDSVATEVTKEKIDYQAVVDGHIPYPDGISNSEKKQYEFTVSGLASKCYQSGEEITFCPSNADLDKYNIIETYLSNSDSGISDKITFQFNDAAGNFTINIKDVFHDELYVRYVYGNRVSNIKEGLDASHFAGQFLTRNANGTYSISGVAGRTSITLEFYIKKAGGCSGSYIGYISFETPNPYDYEVDNPALTNPDSYGCTAVKNYRPAGMTRTDDLQQLESVKKTYIHECYSNAKITYGEKLELASQIQQKLTHLQEMFSSYTGSVATGSKICTDQYSSGSKITYSSAGSYWAMTCWESYTAQGDTPKLVKAGDGFSYQTNYSVTRTCAISQIAKPTKKAQCVTSISHNCSWIEKSGTKSGNDAGPTEEFDNCIYSCDGGIYSQSCINSCYSQVYQNSRDISFVDKFVTTTRGTKTKFVSSVTFSGPNTGYGCTTDHGRPGRITQYCENGVCDSACFSTWCGNNGGQCTFNVYKGPAGCSDNPEAEYQAALNASEAELNRLKAKQTEVIPTGNYTYQITDSYLKTEGGQPYVFTVNSQSNPIVQVSSSQSTVSSSNATANLGNSGGRQAGYNPSVTVKANITVNLPLSYIDRVNGDAVYKTSTDSKQAYRANHLQNRLEVVDQFDAVKYYNQNERKYYTSIWSSNINTIVVDGKVQLLRNSDYNIKVKSSNVGAGSFGSDIDCYYGVYNNFYCEDPEDCPETPNSGGPNSGGPNSGNSNLDPTGIQWIYRVIDLEDVFPNDRNPRWNWTGTLNRSNSTYTGAARFAKDTYLKYNIDPIALTNEIETKGYTIYNVKTDASEVDYEFVLTTENLRNIRAYNKNVYDYNGDGYHNYADYNMSCYTNSSGKEICTSRFMDNINGNSGTEASSNFITYSVPGFTIDARKDIAGCNNSKSGSCVDVK